MKSLRTQRGFTLIELVIVIAIIGILAALAIPRFLDLSLAAREASTRAGLGTVRAVLATRYAQSATGGAAATFPTAVSASDFAAEPPRNNVQATPLTVVTAVTATTTGTTTSGTAGFWYVSGPTSSTDYGKAGAYSDGTVNTSAY